MTHPKMIAMLKLLTLVAAMLLLWRVAPAPHLAASVEIASFRASLSVDGASVRLRTGAFDTGQLGIALLGRAR